MFYVYILKSEKDRSLYIGKTNDVERRLAEHNSGHTSATKSKRPYMLLEAHECDSVEESIRVEKEYKKGYKREAIRRKYGLV
jgi:putative endonuclease